MSRGQDRRQAARDQIIVMASIRGHDSTIVHSFNHTDGHCPKCGNNQQFICLCNPDENLDLPRIRGCSLEGEHLHRVCAACKYPWVERPMDQAMLAESEGSIIAESELAACLAVVAERVNGIELDHQLVTSRRGYTLRFVRDPAKGMISITAEPTPPTPGRVRHPAPEDLAPQGGAA